MVVSSSPTEVPTSTWAIPEAVSSGRERSRRRRKARASAAPSVAMVWSAYPRPITSPARTGPSAPFSGEASASPWTQSTSPTRCHVCMVLEPREALIFSRSRGGVRAWWATGRDDVGVVNEQPSFTDIEYGNRRRVSRREKFLDTMDGTVPWQAWVAVIEPHYYQDRKGKRGRKPVPIETMLRMYLLQVWFSLSDEGVEEAIYDSYAMRRFMGLDFTVQQVPDATTLLHFRHLLEQHDLGEALLAAQNEILSLIHI